MTNRDSELAKLHRERLLWFGLTFAVIALSAIVWLARLIFFESASAEIKLGLLVLYLLLPFSVLGMLSFSLNRSRQRWVLQLCIASMYSYLILWATTANIRYIRYATDALREGIDLRSATIVGSMVVLTLIVFGSLVVFWQRALNDLPRREEGEE